MAQQASQKTNSPEASFKRAGITRPYEVLLWIPKRHEDYSITATGENYPDYLGQKVCIKLTAISHPSFMDKGRFSVSAVDDLDHTHRLMLFGILKLSPWNNVHPGDTVWIRAKVVEQKGHYYLNGAEWIEPEQVGQIRPVYQGKTGVIGSAVITNAAREAIQQPELLADTAMAIRESFGGLEQSSIIELAKLNGTLEQTLKGVHAPSNMDTAAWAMDGAKKIAVAYIQWAAANASIRPMSMRSVIRIKGDMMRELVAKVPFPLTQGEGSQTDAVRNIIELLAAPYPMNALLSADVGTGKTVCYGLAAAAAQKLGHRVAILIPNTILVDQVAGELRSMFPAVPFTVIADGANELPKWEENPVLVGTTKLFGITEKAKWVADLVVIDEQQKMGEAQRNRLRASHTNVLEATATPLPRTMALLTHGDKHLIQITKQHANKKILTQVLGVENKKEMFQKVKNRVASGEPVVIIYPRVDASKERDTKSATSAGEMWERLYPGMVAVLHGKLKDEEKILIMRRIKTKKVKIIIASSILEIGITVDDLRFLMVVHAERYGVFTLHQFRGRCARHGGEGECLLYLPDIVEAETLERIQLLERTNNGFELAELDMQMRGFGDLAEQDSTQSGKTPTLFRGILLMPHDFQ